MSKDTSFDVLTGDVKLLQTLLQRGSLKSVDLVDLYMAQIQKHDSYLHAMLSMPSKESLKKIAHALDEERLQGTLRSALHGIPIVIKVGWIPLGLLNASLTVAGKYRYSS